jgi:predicted nuclease of restriction endonuclease-like RecB superfamily
VISPDLVRARRRGERLELVPLRGPARTEAERLAADITDALATALGQSEEEVQQLLVEIPRPPSAEKLFSGLTKVILDECQFEAPLEVDAPELRRAVFEHAAMRRREDQDRTFVREQVLAEVATTLGVTPEAVEQSLFSDLRGARLLVSSPTQDPHDVLERYETAQIQGVLLRAVRIGLDVVCRSPDAYRELFRKLKFRRLLHRVEAREGGGYHIEIDGPFSLLESVTKYGLALGQLVPTLQKCQKVDLCAELRWGAKRQKLEFRATLGGGADSEPPEVRDEVQALLSAVNREGTGFLARPGTDLFDLPGVGVVIPDLVLEDAAGRLVHVEVMGYWSREAVFRRLDWVRAQKKAAGPASAEPLRLLLAVSSQLRVSPEAEPPEAAGTIYVYKGTISAKALLKQAQALCQGAV